MQHPLELVDVAHRAGYDVLLDAAAFVPTNPLDLSQVKPDFVPISWYKVCGLPTGVGCLVARWSALARLRRPWFAGGTIAAVSVLADWHQMLTDEGAYEDGTLNYLSIPDVDVGLQWIQSIGVDLIRDRVRCLTGWLLARLTDMVHRNGSAVARVYGPTDVSMRGGTVALNLLSPAGVVVDERLVAAEAAAHGLSLRTGCFCNPGAGEGAFGIGKRHMRGSSRWGARTIDEYLTMIGLPSGGAVRVSLGLASTIDDVERFLAFVSERYRDRVPSAVDLEPRLRC